MRCEVRRSGWLALTSSIHPSCSRTSTCRTPRKSRPRCGPAWKTDVAFEFKLPDLGEGIHEAQVLAWKVAPGQQVAAFQALCEVESAKAAVELTAPVAGRVLETRVAEGDVAHLGDVLVVIETDNGAALPE